jgi:hypothetical protein
MRYDFLWHVAYTLGVIPFSFAAYLLSASDMVWPRRIMARQVSFYHKTSTCGSGTIMVPQVDQNGMLHSFTKTIALLYNVEPTIMDHSLIVPFWHNFHGALYIGAI